MILNLVEVCTDAADMVIDKLVILNKIDTNDVYYEEDDVQYYTEEWQEKFEDLYNGFWNLLEEQGYKNECV